MENNIRNFLIITIQAHILHPNRDEMFVPNARLSQVLIHLLLFSVLLFLLELHRMPAHVTYVLIIIIPITVIYNIYLSFDF